jgi:hypothetical protein
MRWQPIKGCTTLSWGGTKGIGSSSLPTARQHFAFGGIVDEPQSGDDEPGRTNVLLYVIDNLQAASFYCEEIRRDASSAWHHVNAFAGLAYVTWESLANLCKPEASGAEQCSSCGYVRSVFSGDSKEWEWFKKAKSSATGSSIGKYFHRGRREHVHGGEGLVTGWSSTLFVTHDGKFESSSEPLLREVTGLRPPKPAADACEDYMALLVGVVNDGYVLFRTDWDPSLALQSAIDSLVARWLKGKPPAAQ